MNKPILKIENLKKYFHVPDGLLHAVDNLNFEIAKGECLGIVGESGCGKSTTGRLILKLLDATEGKVIFEDRNVYNLKGKNLLHFRKKAQIIFQDPFASLNPRMTVSEIIAEPLIIHKIVTKHKLEEEVFRLMDLVGLARRLVNSYPHELDGGRRQRVGIARALSLKPNFIVCDEPVSSLDVSIQAQILNLLQDLRDEFKLTYIFITHDLSVVKHFSDSIMVMYLGQMVEKASADDLFENPSHPYTKALLSAIPVPNLNHKKDRVILKGEISSPINPKPGCRFAQRCIYATEACNETVEITKMADRDHFIACTRWQEIARQVK